MIDTVKLKLSPCKWRSDWSDRWELQEVVRGKRQYSKREKRFEELCSTGRMLICRETGLRVWGSTSAPAWVEVSLPRLVHGRNGVLLRNDEEIQCGLQLLRSSVLEVVCDYTGDHYWDLFLKFTRVDLCWQFRGDVDKWIQALRVAGHPRVQRPTVIYNGSGLQFPGDGLFIRVYDKRREVHHRRGDVIRVELQMRSAKLVEFGLQKFDQAWLDGFSRLWSIFKDLVLQFNPGHLHEVNSLGELLAVLEAQGVKVGSQTPFEIWAAGKHRGTVSRMKRVMREVLPRRCDIDLWDLCAVPVPVDLADEVMQGDERSDRALQKKWEKQKKEQMEKRKRFSAPFV